jgi:CDP-diacylglycerol--glycerol-3-phosphate 3-phosphatidyltransferase/cardiolipin synthase
MGRSSLRVDASSLGRPHDASPQRLIGPADFVTAIRLPLAVAFPLVPDWTWRMAFVLLAGITDVLDGWLARRLGSSRIGAVLDPIADKSFMLSAFLTLIGTQATEVLTIWELGLVLSRDLASIAAFCTYAAMHRQVTLPARLSGKLVTVCQFLVLLAILFGWEHVRPLAWLTGAAALVSIVDYYRAGSAEVRRRYGVGGNSRAATASEDGEPAAPDVP